MAEKKYLGTRRPGGGARLVLVDFGQARLLGALGKLCLKLCGDDHRLVDPTDADAPSEATDADAIELQRVIGDVLADAPPPPEEVLKPIDPELQAYLEQSAGSALGKLQP